MFWLMHGRVWLMHGRVWLMHGRVWLMHGRVWLMHGRVWLKHGRVWLMHGRVWLMHGKVWLMHGRVWLMHGRVWLMHGHARKGLTHAPKGLTHARKGLTHARKGLTHVLDRDVLAYVWATFKSSTLGESHQEVSQFFRHDWCSNLFLLRGHQPTTFLSQKLLKSAWRSARQADFIDIALWFAAEPSSAWISEKSFARCSPTRISCDWGIMTTRLSGNSCCYEIADESIRPVPQPFL